MTLATRTVNVYGLDTSLWRQFHAVCSLRGLPMGATLNALLKAWLAQQQRKDGTP